LEVRSQPLRLCVYAKLNRTGVHVPVPAEKEINGSRARPRGNMPSWSNCAVTESSACPGYRTRSTDCASKRVQGMASEGAGVGKSNQGTLQNESASAGFVSPANLAELRPRRFCFYLNDAVNFRAVRVGVLQTDHPTGLLDFAQHLVNPNQRRVHDLLTRTDCHR
jgi:hypothetical protein